MKHLTITLLTLLMSMGAWAEFNLGLKCSDEELNINDANFVEKWILMDRVAKKIRVFHIETYKREPFIFRDRTFNFGEKPDYYYWSDLDPSKYSGRKYNSDGSWTPGWLSFVNRSNGWKLDRETLLFDERIPCELSDTEQVTREIDSALKEKRRKEREKKLNKEKQDAEQLKKNKI